MAEKRWIVVGLTQDGDELDRITIVESKLEAAIDLFSEFADWVEVIDPEGKAAPRTAWPRQEKASGRD
jgi:hypothetical protein